MDYIHNSSAKMLSLGVGECFLLAKFKKTPVLFKFDIIGDNYLLRY